MNKQKLKSLIELKNQYLQSKNIFEKQRLFFNMKVEDKIRKEQLENTLEAEGHDHYENAKYIIEILQEAFQEIAFQHPDYSREEIQKMLLEDDELKLFEQDYALYKSCGYFEVKEKEKDFETAKEKIIIKMKESKKQVSKSLSKMGNTAIKIVKPYGEVAKGQLAEASIIAKKTINKGSKKLMKTLQNVADKTETSN